MALPPESTAALPGTRTPGTVSLSRVPLELVGSSSIRAAGAAREGTGGQRPSPGQAGREPLGDIDLPLMLPRHLQTPPFLTGDALSPTARPDKLAGLGLERKYPEETNTRRFGVSREGERVDD